ncbi:hypothetical protein FACS1894162_0850 [Bacteroidia bacterium]|nr:hypothetical protein FACS1894162_0850 [Bacteroidia bacterium]
MKRYISLLFLVFFAATGFSQSSTTYNAATFGSAASGEHTPFWMVNHNWGVTALEADNFYVRGGVFHDQTLNKDWSWAAGIDFVGGSSSPYGKVWVQQLYGRLNWKIWRLDMGSKEDYTSLLHSQLSSGDFVNSNNARPVPQVKISMPEFLLVPYTKGIFFIKGDFSAGKLLDGQWMEDRALPANQSYVKDIFTHNKSVDFRFGNIEKQHKQQFTLRVAHAAQWGGTLYPFTYQGQYEPQKQPHGISDFLRVVIAKEGSSNSSWTDAAYVSGSQWGAYTFRYDYKLKNDNRLGLYIHHFFDDGSGMAFSNYSDNLTGLEFRSKKKSLLSAAVLEYIHTRTQTGPIHFNPKLSAELKGETRDISSVSPGNDNYYNNVDYVPGPSYFGKSTGTPLFLSPEYNTDGTINFKGTRIVSWHLGLEGYVLPQLQYRVLLTTGKNWGRYYRPFLNIKKGVASQLELIYACPKTAGLNLKLNVGYDQGDFFGGDTFGAGITLQKRGIIR